MQSTEANESSSDEWEADDDHLALAGMHEEEEEIATATKKEPTIGVVQTRLHELKAKALLDKQDYAGAVGEVNRGLDMLPGVANLLLVKGRALLSPLLDRVMNDQPWRREEFIEIGEAFQLAHLMDARNPDALMELQRLTEKLSILDASVEQAAQAPAPPKDPQWYLNGAEAVNISGDDDEPVGVDVIVVGAGAAGIGCAFMLTHVFGLDPSRVLLLERGDASFDLNSVAYGTSPAFTLHTQHPSGEQYADYLATLAKAAKMSVKLRTEVVRIEPVDGVFDVHVRTESADGMQQKEETLRTRKVVWACGEFQYPREKSSDKLSGAELCVHNSRVRSWASLPGDDFVLIGGYESGADAAVNLAKAGKQCTVLASTASWNLQHPDPSVELAPYTAERLRDVTAAGFSPRPKLMAPLRVLRVEKAAEGGFNVVAAWKAAEPTYESAWKLRKPLAGQARMGRDEGSELVVHTAQPPVLCTGFEGSVASSARYLFDLADESAKGCLANAPLLTDEDESTKVSGVFLVGPTVSHGENSFCFIYKFRQRFGIVANAICRGLGEPAAARASAVENCRKMNMYLDDLKCCEAKCGEAC